jgi:ABC-type uncharacterized transport system involved in gliding motility auxiliary subunit
MQTPFTARRSAAALALLCAVILLVGINVIADRLLRGDRIDLTDQKLFTLASGSRSTLAKIDEPLTIRFYFSKRLGDEIPSYGLYAQRVREMLQEYTALARGKIRLEELNPAPFSDVEDRAVAFGLQGVPIDQGGEQVYFGLAATNSTDDQQVIPFFQPERERFLEYDLTKLVRNLAFPKKTVVGLITSLPLEGDMMAMMQGMPTQPVVILEQLRQLYDVRTMGGDIEKIGDDVDVLFIAHPQNMSEKTQFAVDQFVLKGGKALVFVDPQAESQAARPSRFNPPGSPADSNLDKLFAAWGVEMLPKTIAGDAATARRVNAGTSLRVQPASYLAWMTLKKANFNANDPITAELSSVNVGSAGILQPRDGAKTKLEPLITTTPGFSGKIAVEKVQGPMPDIQGILRDFKRELQPLIIAARVTGDAETAFPDGPPKPPAKEGEEKKDEAKPDEEKTSDAKSDEAKKDEPKKDEKKPEETSWLKKSAQPINVIVVSDTDLLDDRFWVQAQDFFGQRVIVPSANNGDFVANAVEALAGGNELISLRSRGTAARPFEVVQNIQKNAEERYSAEERDLQEKLKATQGKIKDLRSKDSQGGIQLTADQTKALEDFQADMLSTRQQLRKVQLEMRQDIDRLKWRLQFVDIALVPIVVAIVAIALGVVRLQRRKRRVAHA